MAPADLIRRPQPGGTGSGCSSPSPDISRAHAIARKMKAGTVWVGFGREMGKEALDLYPQVKSVFVKL